MEYRISNCKYILMLYMWIPVGSRESIQGINMCGVVSVFQKRHIVK